MFLASGWHPLDQNTPIKLLSCGYCDVQRVIPYSSLGIWMSAPSSRILHDLGATLSEGPLGPIPPHKLYVEPPFGQANFVNVGPFA